MSIILTLSQDQYELLHQAVEGRAKTVRVDAQALTNLLIDHAALVREARAHGLRVVEPALRRARAAL